MFPKETILLQQYKSIQNISKVVYKYYSNTPAITRLYKHIKKYIKKPIRESVIQQFYEEPEQFFSSFKNNLNNTSLYDISGNSIFVHYFNVLDSKQKSKDNLDIYEKNFQIFFKELGKYLSMQDSCLDTPLHKLAKFKNKNLFFDICQKLYDIGVLSEELLKIKNAEEKSCYDLIIQDISENKKKIIQNYHQSYKNFIELYPILKNSLIDQNKKIIIPFLSKLIIDEEYYQEIGIKETIDNFIILLNDLTDKKQFFEIIYVPSSGINQLNILFEYCFTQENFDKLFNLVLELSQIKILKEAVNPEKKYKTEDDLYNQAVAQHINYVIRYMRKTKEKGDLEINYGLKLSEKIIPNLIQNNLSEVSLRLLYEKYSKDRGSVIYNNKGLLSSLLSNQYISLNQKVDIYNRYYTQLNLDLNSFKKQRKDKDFIVFYFFVNYNDCITLNNKEGFLPDEIKCPEILDDFEFVGFIYKKVYILCHIYFNNEAEIEKYLQKLSAFLKKNYSDLVREYTDLYGLSEEKQKLLFEFIIKFESDYKNDYHRHNKYGYKYFLYALWYSKFILTEPELLYPFLLYIRDEEASQINITSPLCKQIAEGLHMQICILFFFSRIFLVLKYNFEEACKNIEIVPYFNLSINKNYFIINKNEILKVFSSFDDKCLKAFCMILKENPEAFYLYLDEVNDRAGERINSEKLRINLNILQKISNDSKEIMENEEIPSVEMFLDTKTSEDYKDYFIKLIIEAKKQNNSLFNCVKNNKLFFFIILYTLVKFYNKLPYLERKHKVDPKIYDYIIEDINNFFNYYKAEKEKFKDNNLRDVLLLANRIIDSFRENKFIKHIKIIKLQILKNKSDIDFSKIETHINKCIFAFFFYMVYGQKILKKSDYIKEEFSLDFSNFDKNIIDFFFDKFLLSFSPNFQKKIYPSIIPFYDFINIPKTTYITIYNGCIFSYIFEENHNLANFSFVMFYKYIRFKYPDYNSFILMNICHYYLQEKKDKNYFELFYAVINDKSNEKNIEKHLFLIKNEDIPKNLSNKIKSIYKKHNTQNLIFNQLFIIFMNKYLIDMNYSKNSFVFDYLDNNFHLDNIDIIRSVIYNYPFHKNTSYSKTYFYKIIEQLLKERQTIYEFLKEEFIYDINIENTMNKKIKVLEHVFKIYSNEIDPYNRDKTAWQCYIESNWFFGLYAFLKILKEGKKNLLLLSNNNLAFIKDTIFTLSNFRNILLHRNINFDHWINGNIKKEELDKKVQFILQEIHEIFFNFLSSNEFINAFSKDINNKNEEDLDRKEIKQFGYCIYDLVKYYDHKFNKNLDSIKMTKVELNVNFEQFQIILTNITKLPYIKSLISLVDFIPSLVYLFSKDLGKFYTLLTIISNNLKETFDKQYTILLISLLKKNAEKFFSNFLKIKSIIKCDDDWYKVDKSKENLIRLYILNNSIPTIYSKFDFMKDIPPLNDSYKLLRDIKNKESSLFMLNGIINKYNKKNNVQIIIDLMDNIVYNEHIIEYLFKSLKENDIKELIKSGKYINNIIKALFYFSQINGYLLIQKLLFLMKNYAPSFDLKALILPPVQEPYENMVNIEEIFSPPLEDYDEEDKKEFNIMRFLLYCALNYRMINNYETIAVLFEYCPLEEGIDFLIKELMWNNIDNLFIGRIKYIEYFTNPKNKNKIKELGKNFFNFINLVESILNQKDYISKLSDKEKYILINYIKIFLLEIVPKELEIFLENDKENNTQNEERDFNSRNHLLYYPYMN